MKNYVLITNGFYVCESANKDAMERLKAAADRSGAGEVLLIETDTEDVGRKIHAETAGGLTYKQALKKILPGDQSGQTQAGK